MRARSNNLRYSSNMVRSLLIGQPSLKNWADNTTVAMEPACERGTTAVKIRGQSDSAGVSVRDSIGGWCVSCPSISLARSFLPDILENTSVEGCGDGVLITNP